jgi:DNA-binding transcriptional LysR family regulator
VNERKSRKYKALTLSQLRTYCVVCRDGGYAAAARSLDLTTPAVWEQMQSLERLYGTKLLERAGTGVRPTAAGAGLLEMVAPLIAGIDSMREVLAQAGGALPRRLVLATNLRVLSEEVSCGLRAFQRRHPSVALIVDYTGDDVAERVVSGDADVGLTLEPVPSLAARVASASEAVTYQPAGQADYLLVTPPRHPLLRKRALHIRHVVQHPLVLGKPGAYSRRRVQEILHRYDVATGVQIAVETSSDEYTLSCVRAGMGVGITVGTGRGHLYSGLGVRSLRRWFGTARVGFLWQRGAHLSLAQRELANVLSDQLAADRAEG